MSGNTNINIITIKEMINSSIQQGSGGDTKAVLSSEQVGKINEFLTSIDSNVEIMQIQNALINGKGNAKNLVDVYYGKLLGELKTHKINSFGELRNKEKPWGDKICEVVKKMTPLQDKMLSLFKVIIDSNTADIELGDLLERLLQYNFQNIDSFQQTNTSGYLQNDNYRVFIYELTLYTFEYLLDQQKYDEFKKVLSKGYQVKYVHKENSSDPIIKYHTVAFPRFNYPTGIINDKGRRNFYGVHLEMHNMYRDFLVERANRRGIVTIKQLGEADLLLYYLSFYHIPSNVEYPHVWLPYFSDRNTKPDLMLRSVSAGFFERIKGIFGVDTLEEFKQQLPRIGQWQQQYPSLIIENRAPDFLDLPLNLHELCTQA